MTHSSDCPLFDAEVEAAFQALADYTHGGKRSALLPLDRAVVRAIHEPEASRALEQRLISCIDGTTPAAGKQYACGKLTLIGSRTSVPALAGLLHDPVVGTDARTALECLPDDAAAKALLQELHRLTGPAKAGVISSLAVRRYRPAARAIRRALDDPDPAVRSSAERALKVLNQKEPGL